MSDTTETNDEKVRRLEAELKQARLDQQAEKDRLRSDRKALVTDFASTVIEKHLSGKRISEVIEVSDLGDLHLNDLPPCYMEDEVVVALSQVYEVKSSGCVYSCKLGMEGSNGAVAVTFLIPADEVKGMIDSLPKI